MPKPSIERARLTPGSGWSRRGRTFSHPDLLIVATAAEAALIAVTRDLTHFIAARVPVLNPWTGRYVAADGSSTTLTQLETRDLV